MSENLAELDRHVRVCIVIFVCLMVLTGITVGASYLEVSTPAAITIALCIAFTKGSMVMAYFMHLVSEKKLIYFSIILTACFFIFLITLPVWGNFDIIKQMQWMKY